MEKLLNDLVNAFPGTKLTPQNVAIYLENLSDISEPVLAQAVKNIIISATWFPKIAELRAEAMKIWNAQGRYAERDVVLNKFVSDGEDILKIRQQQIELVELDAAEGFHFEEWQQLLDECKDKDYQMIADGIRRRMESERVIV